MSVIKGKGPSAAQQRHAAFTVAWNALQEAARNDGRREAYAAALELVNGELPIARIRAGLRSRLREVPK